MTRAITVEADLIQKGHHVYTYVHKWQRYWHISDATNFITYIQYAYFKYAIDVLRTPNQPHLLSLQDWWYIVRNAVTCTQVEKIAYYKSGSFHLLKSYKKLQAAYKCFVRSWWRIVLQSVAIDFATYMHIKIYVFANGGQFTILWIAVKLIFMRHANEAQLLRHHKATHKYH